MSTKYRIQIVPSEYQIGDAEAAAEVQRILEQDGAWGFIVEKWADAGEPCPTCKHAEPGHWEHVDSCFGYLGDKANADYMLECALESIPAGVSGPIVDENGREINTFAK